METLKSEYSTHMGCMLALINWAAFRS